ncbi:hypothetical protein PO124_32845 [Bacillus licheniformis]|nr:hypothetical protein [Bacillus licheniformis]
MSLLYSVRFLKKSFQKDHFGAIYEKRIFVACSVLVRCSSRSSIWISAICSFIRQWDSHSPFICQDQPDYRPDFAHVAMNTLVVLLQTFREPIEEY